MTMNEFGNTLVVIPARGGSKRIPRKNIKPICGRPMIAWPIDELLKVYKTDQVFVSTDDDEIKSISQSMDIDIPFLRPKELSGDHVGTMEVATHALQEIEFSKAPVDYTLIVYPTAIMVRWSDIHKAYELLRQDDECMSVFSAAEYPYPVQRAIRAAGDGKIRMVEPMHYNSRSQDLELTYHDAGQFYLCRSELVREGGRLISENSRIVLLPRARTIDIDTPADFEMAEVMLAASLKDDDER